jgi:uncharacterized protein YkwD
VATSPVEPLSARVKLWFFCAGCALATIAVPSAPGDPAIMERASLDRPIDTATFDRGLLGGAIFRESNRVRESLGLRPFKTIAKLDEAADLEAAVGRVYQPPSHTNPFPRIGTPLERVRFVGLKPGRVAENIALLSVYDVPAKIIEVTVRNGKRHFVHPETGAELEPVTYRRFAALVVQAWMESPGHRKNLLDAGLTHLGCSVQASVNALAGDQIFCVQVFFAPAG